MSDMTMDALHALDHVTSRLRDVAYDIAEIVAKSKGHAVITADDVDAAARMVMAAADRELSSIKERKGG